MGIGGGESWGVEVAKVGARRGEGVGGECRGRGTCGVATGVACEKQGKWHGPQREVRCMHPCVESFSELDSFVNCSPCSI